MSAAKKAAARSAKATPRRAAEKKRAKPAGGSHAAARKAILKAALAYPGAWEDHPWGDTVVKAANKKVFVFLSSEGPFGMSCKLPHSAEAAITMFSWAEPTGYGLGESGWVTASFDPWEEVPVPLLLEWLAESYAAVGPKREPRAARKAAR